ncbi:DNA cytosine methyltransferase [Archangium sp.]|uniref:DNA cytosine methyltransferase n=1 Tax=Archangium sp. TaxID=1872627 RepID=UPI00389B1F79
MKALELFVGAGGLALGVSRAGFKHEAVVELDAEACATIRENQRRLVAHVRDWPLYQGDVRELRYSGIRGDLDLLAAGAPCQPFSFGGKGLGDLDQRNMFPEVLRAVLELEPRAVLIENVKGLTSSRFRPYLDYIILRMTYPHLSTQDGETWASHLKRLQEIHSTGLDVAKYNVKYCVLNAADFGVPQWRERVFIVGFRADLGIWWESPQPTHSLDELLRAQWFDGSYWADHDLPKRHHLKLAKRYANRLRYLRLQGGVAKSRLKRWNTIRDAITNLPKIRIGSVAKGVENHFLNPGARKYQKHTGSRLDEAAKTLKAGSHGVPGGENMLQLDDGRVRYFSVRECARLQTFPDEYVFSGAWTRCMRQLGNAVPVRLGEIVAETIKEQLEALHIRSDRSSVG